MLRRTSSIKHYNQYLLLIHDGTFTRNFTHSEDIFLIINLVSDLSNTMVGALSITPLFSFPFYGHLVSELFITTHGFLSLSPRLHDYIYKTQYIAPLRIKVSNHQPRENIPFKHSNEEIGNLKALTTTLQPCTVKSNLSFLQNAVLGCAVVFIALIELFSKY